MRGMEVILVVASRHKSRQVARYKFYQIMDTLYNGKHPIKDNLYY